MTYLVESVLWGVFGLLVALTVGFLFWRRERNKFYRDYTQRHSDA